MYKPFVYEQAGVNADVIPSATRPPALNPGYVPEADLVVTSPPMATDVRIAPNSVKNELLPQATQVGGKQNILKMLKTLNNKYNLK